MKKRILYIIWYTIMGSLFRLFPIKNNRVVFCNFFGRGFGDNGKYIAKELLNRGGYEVVWLLSDISTGGFPDGIRKVKRRSLAELYYLSTARVWVDNSRKPYGSRKRKKQFYIQTWHGGFPIKKIEKAVEDKLSKQYVLSAKNDSKMIDVALSNNGLLTKVYLEDFWYDKKIIECGCPRNDIIFNANKDVIKKVYDYYDIDEDVKLCLYAPTFRVDGSLSAYNIDFNRLLISLKKKFGGEWKILIRLHPNVSKKSASLIRYNEDIIDASKYDDMQELLVATDFMITDYSSCIFDFAISLKKCCIYASDIEDYSKDRGFYLSLDEYPFEIARNNDELTSIIENFDNSMNKKRIVTFFDKVKIFEDGKGTKTVANLIRDVVEGRYDETN